MKSQQQSSSIKAVHIIHLEQAANKINSYSSPFKPSIPTSRSYRPIKQGLKYITNQKYSPLLLSQQSVNDQISSSRSCFLKAFSLQKKPKKVQSSKYFEHKIDQLKKEIEQTKKLQLSAYKPLQVPPQSVVYQRLKHLQREKLHIISQPKESLPTVLPITKHLFLETIFEKQKVTPTPTSAPNTPEIIAKYKRAQQPRSISHNSVRRIQKDVQTFWPAINSDFHGWDIKEDDDYIRLG